MNIPKYIDLFRKDLDYKNYSKNTINNYVSQIKVFLNSFDKIYTEPSKINSDDFRSQKCENYTSLHPRQYSIFESSKCGLLKNI